MVSVLVCTYNHEKYIAQAIESILMQKCTEPFEILVGDDCSTDGTGKIVDEYKQRYPDNVYVIRPEKNRGAATNFVSLISKSKGEYLAVCDGDDYWLRDDVLQRQLDIFKSHPEVGMICAKAKCYNQGKGTFEGTLGYAGAEDLMTMLRDNRDVAAPTIAFRKDLMLKFIADSEWYVSHNHIYDTVMAYWFATYSKIKYMDEEWAAYRVLPNSASHAKTLGVSREYERRYFYIKWHFILTHPELYGEEIYEILMRDYDEQVAHAMYVTEVKTHSSKSYKMGKKIVDFAKKIRNYFEKK